MRIPLNELINTLKTRRGNTPLLGRDIYIDSSTIIGIHSPYTDKAIGVHGFWMDNLTTEQAKKLFRKHVNMISGNPRIRSTPKIVKEIESIPRRFLNAARHDREIEEIRQIQAEAAAILKDRMPAPDQTTSTIEDCVNIICEEAQGKIRPPSEPDRELIAYTIQSILNNERASLLTADRKQSDLQEYTLSVLMKYAEIAKAETISTAIGYCQICSILGHYARKPLKDDTNIMIFELRHRTRQEILLNGRGKEIESKILELEEEYKRFNIFGGRKMETKVTYKIISNLPEAAVFARGKFTAITRHYLEDGEQIRLRINERENTIDAISSSCEEKRIDEIIKWAIGKNAEKARDNPLTLERAQKHVTQAHTIPVQTPNPEVRALQQQLTEAYAQMSEIGDKFEEEQQELWEDIGRLESEKRALEDRMEKIQTGTQSAAIPTRELSTELIGLYTEYAGKTEELEQTADGKKLKEYTGEYQPTEEEQKRYEEAKSVMQMSFFVDKEAAQLEIQEYESRRTIHEGRKQKAEALQKSRQELEEKMMQYEIVLQAVLGENPYVRIPIAEKEEYTPLEKAVITSSTTIGERTAHATYKTSAQDFEGLKQVKETYAQELQRKTGVQLSVKIKAIGEMDL